MSPLFKGFDHPVTVTKYNMVTGAASKLPPPPNEVGEHFLNIKNL